MPYFNMLCVACVLSAAWYHYTQIGMGESDCHHVRDCHGEMVHHYPACREFKYTYTGGEQAVFQWGVVFLVDGQFNS